MTKDDGRRRVKIGDFWMSFVNGPLSDQSNSNRDFDLHVYHMPTRIEVTQKLRQMLNLLGFPELNEQGHDLK